MKLLNFSRHGLEILNKLHRKKVVIFVEEKDDKLFWGKTIERYEIENYYIEICGCKQRLIDTYNKLKNTKTRFVIMCDNDYDSILNKSINDYRFIFSYGYSIENTLYCPMNISRIISNELRDIIDTSTTVEEWYELIEEESFDLLTCDLANVRFEKNIAVMGDSSGKFISSCNSINIDIKKTIIHLEKIIEQFTISDLYACQKLIKNDQRKIRYLIRGHFLTLLIINYVNYHIKKSGKENKNILSKNNLFTSLVDGCDLCKINGCYDYRLIDKKIKKVMKKYSI